MSHPHQVTLTGYGSPDNVWSFSWNRMRLDTYRLIFDVVDGVPINPRFERIDPALRAATRDAELQNWASCVPPGATWVCPDCDIVGCRHWRSRHATRPDAHGEGEGR